ncbi:MAG: DUF1700 domain-containing protein [Dehalococcoidales bacterium]|nr:DUF1700 domain-containing protein [Dehalococcoidales bacterium]
MSTIVQEYLNNVRNNLRLEPADEKEVLSELATHIEDEIQDLKKSGLHEEEAASICIRLLGSAKLVARQIYEAHSQGTWRQALLACLPHLLFGLVFLLNWWRGIVPVLVMLVLILSTTVYGWWHRRASWLFPWVGYSLLPVVAAGLSLLYLPRGFAWLAVLIYLPLALWLLYRIVSQTIRKDWVYISLMLLPMPVIICWFLTAEWQEGFTPETIERFYYYGPWIGGSFLALAFGVVSFVRIRKRWLKISVLFMAGLIAISLIAFYARGRLEFIQLLLLFLFLASIFLIPAMLENGVRSGRWGKIFEHHPLI